MCWKQVDAAITEKLKRSLYQQARCFIIQLGLRIIVKNFLIACGPNSSNIETLQEMGGSLLSIQLWMFISSGFFKACLYFYLFAFLSMF